MTQDELIPAVVIVKELTVPDGGIWPFSVFEVRDDRNGIDYARPRIAYRFRETTPHIRMNLFRRLQQLSSHQLPGVAMPLEWSPTPDGGFCVLFEMTDRLEALGRPDAAQVWGYLEQIAAGLAELHGRGIAHGHLTLGNLFVGKNGEAQIQGAGWGPLPHWSEGAYVGESTAKIRPSGQHADAFPVPADDVYALGRAFCAWTDGKPLAFPTRARQRLFDHLVGDDPIAIPKDGKELLSQVRRARATSRFAEAMAVAKAAAGRVLVHARRRPVQIGIAALVLAGVVAASWWIFDFAQTKQAEIENLKSQIKQSSEQIDGLQKTTVARVDFDRLNDQNKELTEKVKLHDDKTGKPKEPYAAKPRPLSEAEIRDRAEVAWTNLAYRDDLSFERMKMQIEDDQNLAPKVKEQLRKWYEELQKGETGRTDGWWSFGPNDGQFNKSALNSDWFKFKIDVNGEKAVDVFYDPTKWQSFKWQPGDSIAIQPYQLGRISNVPFATKTYNGPLALWRFARENRIGSAEGTFMQFEFKFPPEPTKLAIPH